MILCYNDIIFRKYGSHSKQCERVIIKIQYKYRSSNRTSFFSRIEIRPYLIIPRCNDRNIFVKIVEEIPQRREVVWFENIYSLPLSLPTTLTVNWSSLPSLKPARSLFFPFHNSKLKAVPYRVAKGTLASLILDTVCSVSLRGWRTRMGYVYHQVDVCSRKGSEGRFASRESWFSEKFYGSSVLISRKIRL